MSLPRLGKDDEIVTPIVTSHQVRLSANWVESQRACEKNIEKKLQGASRC